MMFPGLDNASNCSVKSKRQTVLHSERTSNQDHIFKIEKL